ncbi:MAG: cell division protein ZapA [Calditrichaeota bacterium]|nr:MAG: cell division protein ZapA [Calditrichota bacterium]
MNQENNVLKINIYGTEYPIKSDSATDPEYIKKVAAYVDQKMQEVGESTQVKSTLKVAILAALNITDELFQEREEKIALVGKLQGKIENLTRLLNQYLIEE